jgi:hypothetical protein
LPRTRPGIRALWSFSLFEKQTLGTRRHRTVSAPHRQPIFVKTDFLKGDTMTKIVKAHQHFTSAVESLACGVGPIQERLCDAAGHIANVDAKDIPEDLRDSFETIRRDLSSGGRPHEGKLSDSDAASTARSILSLKDKLSDRAGAPRRMA